MKLLADENVDFPIVQSLRSSGHEVLYVAEQMSQADDDEVIKMANRESAVLLTGDKGIGGRIMFRSGTLTHGLVILRLEGLSSVLKTKIVESAFRNFGAQLSGNMIMIVSAGQVRIRRI